MENKPFDFNAASQAVYNHQDAYFNALEVLEEQFYAYVVSDIGFMHHKMDELADLCEAVFVLLKGFENGLRYKALKGRSFMMDFEIWESKIVSLYDVIENTPVHIVLLKVRAALALHTELDENGFQYDPTYGLDNE